MRQSAAPQPVMMDENARILTLAPPQAQGTPAVGSKRAAGTQKALGTKKRRRAYNKGRVVRSSASPELTMYFETPQDAIEEITAVGDAFVELGENAPENTPLTEAFLNAVEMTVAASDTFAELSQMST